MPSTPLPVVDPRFGPTWTPITQAIHASRRQDLALSGIKATLGSVVTEADSSAAVYTPSSPNVPEAVSSPTVTTQIGTSGQALVTVSGLVELTSSATSSIFGTIQYAYTPEGGSPSGRFEIARFLIGPSSSSLSISGTVSGINVVKGLPAGLVTWNLSVTANGVTVGASFTDLGIIVQPL